MKTEIELLKKVYACVDELPFGEHMALPWCRESFPLLDKAMIELQEFYKIQESKGQQV